jgi:hypothetical protein
MAAIRTPARSGRRDVVAGALTIANEGPGGISGLA